MINNFICNDCSKRTVCKWHEVIVKKFDEDSKSAFDMAITINQCAQYVDNGDVFEDK